ncbi:hypothetical protein E2K93_11550 [Thalassotalea sp. HSM 43]|uniref:hypothetical protein n=1 Tax=Thalassotalea sp. HSM 43 TaxID=2552945 RepID=UPI001080B16F|nr:hypothetical protein [Thalassotalea sp. HSM 43]QBY04979.1 hypothetical protein E2K93_11550 [Thalassotalea sp. HSM 43]
MTKPSFKIKSELPSALLAALLLLLTCCLLFRLSPASADDGKASSKELLDKTLCREATAKYQLADENGYLHWYQGQVQVHVKVVSIIGDDTIRIRILSWYAHDETLRQWQPYLKKPPLLDNLVLETGSYHSVKLKQWYLCADKPVTSV